MLKQQSGHGLSAVLSLQLGGASLVPLYLVSFHISVSRVLYNIETAVSDIVARVDAPDVPCRAAAVGGENGQAAIRAAGNILVVHSAPEIFIFGIYANLIFLCEERQLRLSLGVVVAENYGERDVFLRYRRDYLFDGLIHIFICELLPVAADVVAAENHEVGTGEFNASAD